MYTCAIFALNTEPLWHLHDLCYKKINIKALFITCSSESRAALHEYQSYNIYIFCIYKQQHETRAYWCP